MLTFAAENRRALRRLLKALVRGESNYVRGHPATLRWLAQHPKIDVDLWWSGIRRTEGDVMLEVEADPLQALRLGTFVGSCLGLGGGFAASAAAAVLDINKRVRVCGTVRGAWSRVSFLAIADDDRLVCFDVYPGGANATLRRTFAEYDRAFAAALKLPGDRRHLGRLSCQHRDCRILVR